MLLLNVYDVGIYVRERTMKVTINELKALILDVLNEVSDVNAAVLRLRDLASSSSRDPRMHGPTLLAFVRGLGGDDATIYALKGALAKRDAQSINSTIEAFISSRVRAKRHRGQGDATRGATVT
jgi:hypothetical protein